VFKTMGSRSKGQGCVRKDGSHSKGWGCVLKGRAPIRNDGVTFRKDRLVFEATQLCFEKMGSRSKRCGCVRKDRLLFETMGFCA